MHDCPKGDYQLVFSDEFDGDSVDLSVWEIQVWQQGALDEDQSQEFYQLKNALIENGICNIIAKEETITARSVYWEPEDKIMKDGRPNLREFYYTSASLWLKERFKYGKLEARCRQPEGLAFWPAFWLYGGPIGNEIDVFDSYGNSTELITGVGYAFEGSIATKGCSQSIPNVADFTQWHVFTCIYAEDKIIWQVDGQTIRTYFRYLSVDGNPFGCGDNIAQGIYLEQLSFPRDSMHPIISMGVQRGKNGPDASTKFPAVFQVDYVRFYELEEVNPVEILPYPNPTNGEFSIKSPVQMDNIFVSDLTGKRILKLEKAPPGVLKLDIRNYPPGMYFFEVITNGEWNVFKIVKY